MQLQIAAKSPVLCCHQANTNEELAISPFAKLLRSLLLLLLLLLYRCVCIPVLAICVKAASGQQVVLRSSRLRRQWLSRGARRGQNAQ